jgi:outer membrane protein assembly factor BamB
LGLEIAGHAGVSHDETHIFTAFSTGKVAAYDIATGIDRWPDIELVHPGKNGEEQIYFDVDTTPLVVGDQVYFGSAINGVYSLNVESGQELWHRSEAEGVSWLGYFEDAPSNDPAIAANKLVLVGSGLTGLWALDPKTGEVRWRKKVPAGNLAHPVSFGGGILISSSKFGLFFLHATSGDVIDGINPGPGVDNAPAVYGDRAFFLSKSGVLFGLALQTPRPSSESSLNVINSAPDHP